MKLITSLFIMAIVLFLVTGIQSQDLQIQQGNKTKTFKAGHLIRIDLPVKDSMDCIKCPKHSVVGRLISYENQMLSLRVHFESEPIIKNKKDIGEKGNVYKEKMETEWPIIEIPSNSILGITKQGTKRWRPFNAGDLMGASCFMIGTTVILTSFLAEEEVNQEALVGSGATVASIGLIMVAVFNRKTYEIENPLNTKIKHKPWKIK